MLHNIYQVPLKPDYIDDYIRLVFEGFWKQGMARLMDFQKVLCEGALNSTEFLKKVRGYDLLVYDSPTAMCGVLVGELLSIPRVQILLGTPNSLLSFNHMIPMPVSYVPRHYLGFADKMTFIQRLINLASYLSEKLMFDIFFGGMMNSLKVKYNIKPERSYQEAVGDAELVLIAGDFALEYPQPLLPGMI